MARTKYRYAIGIGSNRPLSRQMPPQRIIDSAIGALAGHGVRLIARSATHATRPLGPSLRTFANAAIVVKTALTPEDLLALLQAIERAHGRRRARRWGERTLDLDILLWSGGRVKSRRLTIPHPAMTMRDFVLRPLVEIAPHWRVPPAGQTVAHHAARLNRPRPIC